MKRAQRSLEWSLGGKRERRTDEKNKYFAAQNHTCKKENSIKLNHTHTHTTRTNKKPNSPQKKRSCSCFHPSLRQEKRDEEYDDDDDDVEHAAQHSRG